MASVSMVKGASTPTGSSNSLSGWGGLLRGWAARVSSIVSRRACKWRSCVARCRRAAQFQVMLTSSSVTTSAPRSWAWACAGGALSPAGAAAALLAVAEAAAAADAALAGRVACMACVAGVSGAGVVSSSRYTSLPMRPPRRSEPLTPSVCKLLPAGMWRCTRRNRVLSDSSLADQNHSPPNAKASTTHSPSANHAP